MAEPIVEVRQGKLMGKISKNYKGDHYYSFQGIPYAKPPVGKLRFKAPVPVESWNGIKDVTKEGSESISKHMILDHNVGSEDCLHLSIYTRELPSAQHKNLKPVMLYVHGGGFTSGSNKEEVYGPDFILNEDVVLVVINYRLGLLGFLSLDDPSLEVPGNAGLKDVVLALKWVKDNIAQFNGDPNNVTIFGESAGGAAVHYLILSPAAKGLFHRAIMQSGCTLNPWAFSKGFAFDLAKTLGFESENEKDILNFLQSLPEEKFHGLIDKVTDQSFCVSVLRKVGPVIEKPNKDAFLTKHPIDIMLSGDYNKVPMIFGYNSKEGMLMEIVQQKFLGKVMYPIHDFEGAIPFYYNVQGGTELSKQIANNIKEFYYGNLDPVTADIDKFYDLQSDTNFIRGLYKSLKHHLTSTDQPIYFYRFNIESKLNLFKALKQVTSPGVCHADELGYLFKTVLTPNIVQDSFEDISIRRMVKLWATFAKFGDPNPKKIDDLIDVEWKPVTKDELHYLDFDADLTACTNPDIIDRMEFWDQISDLLKSKM